MYIDLIVKGQKIPYYAFSSKDWQKWRFYMGAALCKIKFKTVLEKGLIEFESIEKDGYAMLLIGEIRLVIFKGSVEYQVSSKDDNGTVLPDEGVIQELDVSKKVEEGCFLLFLTELKEANENNWTGFDMQSLPAIALAELGFYSIEKVLFAEPFELTYGNNAFSNTLTLPFSTTNLVPKITHESLALIGRTYYKLKELKSSDLALSNRIELSLNWFLNITTSSDVNKFISIWVAIEALVLDGETSLKPLKKALYSTYCIPIDKVEEMFHIGKIFRLRSQVVHKGRNLNISIYLVEYLSCLYKDLLNYLLGFLCERLSQEYIDKNPHFVKYITTINQEGPKWPGYVP